MKYLKLFEVYNKVDLSIYNDENFIKFLDEEIIYPSSFICSFVAAAVKYLEGEKVKIYGFSYDENPTSIHFSQEELREGHHFAVLNNRYIIDPWIYEFYGQGVFDLKSDQDEEIIEYIYGNKNNWTDITKYNDNFKKLFPKKFKELKYYYNSYYKN